MELETIIAILGSIAGAFVAIQQVIKAIDRPRPRQTLSEDLEIYSRIPDAIPEKEILASHIKASIESLYFPDTRRKKVDWSQVVILLGMGLILGYWAIYLSREVFSIWSVVVGIFSFSAFSALTDEFKDDSEEKGTR